MCNFARSFFIGKNREIYKQKISKLYKNKLKSKKQLTFKNTGAILKKRKSVHEHDKQEVRIFI